MKGSGQLKLSFRAKFLKILRTTLLNMSDLFHIRHECEETPHC